jgi:hypothetical protein
LLILGLGLFIHGALIRFGVGGAGASSSGFNTISTMAINSRLFAPLLEKVIISTWNDGNIDRSNFLDEIHILELDPIKGFDFGNIYKQFFSNLQAALWLSNNTNCTHVIKIRADQEVPIEIPTWVKQFYAEDTLNQNKIIFSDALSSEPLYSGDFVLAAPIDLFIEFCQEVTSTKRLHPVNAIDYVLKLAALKKRPLPSKNIILRSWQIAGVSSKVEELWATMLLADIAIIPRCYYKKIIWRGAAITDLINSIDTAFLFHEDIGSLKSFPEIKSVAIPDSKKSLSKSFKKSKEHWGRYLLYLLGYCTEFTSVAK